MKILYDNRTKTEKEHKSCPFTLFLRQFILFDYYTSPLLLVNSGLVSTSSVFCFPRCSSLLGAT